MKKRIKKFYSTTGVSPYIWTLFAILPFYFIFQWSSTFQIVLGIILSILFFIAYRFAFISRGWVKYVWTAFLLIISIMMTSLLGYVYFAFFLAYFIGNLQNRAAFLTFYIIHLISATIAINISFFTQVDLFIKQLPFIIIILISIILLPLSVYNRKRQVQLEAELAFANKRISDLIVQQERQRIARDLHDTLGQKLSLIGLKSDLARKILDRDPEKARNELKDIQQTARTALNEVRKMVSNMRGIRLKDEISLAKDILETAGISLNFEGETTLTNVSLLVENILSMCIKEAVTNIVKHSKATTCAISVKQLQKEIIVTISDDGIGIPSNDVFFKGNGLIGMKERLEFINGTLKLVSENGMTLIINVPTIIKQTDGEG